MMDFNWTGLFVIEVTPEAARFLMEKIMEGDGKGIHFFFGPEELANHTVRVFLKDGTDPNVSHLSKRWTTDKIKLLSSLLKVIETHDRNPFPGRTFQEPEFLETFLENNPALPGPIWKVGGGQETAALLLANGFKPRFVPPEEK